MTLLPAIIPPELLAACLAAPSYVIDDAACRQYPLSVGAPLDLPGVPRIFDDDGNPFQEIPLTFYSRIGGDWFVCEPMYARGTWRIAQQRTPLPQEITLWGDGELCYSSDGQGDR